MREIKFRGNTISGKWVYGLLAHDERGWFISNSAGKPFAYAVRPETIGQYTGLKDKNGVEIYEGDICRRDNYDNHIVRFGEYNDNGPSSRPSDSYGWHLESNSPASIVRPLCSIDGLGSLMPRYCVDNEEYAVDRFGLEVIGNIYKNPELLEANQ